MARFTVKTEQAMCLREEKKQKEKALVWSLTIYLLEQQNQHTQNCNYTHCDGCITPYVMPYVKKSKVINAFRQKIFRETKAQTIKTICREPNANTKYINFTAYKLISAIAARKQKFPNKPGREYGWSR